MTTQQNPDLDPPDGRGPDETELVLGHVSSLLRVHGQVAVHGLVTGGASLAWGSRLEVRGTFRGPAHLSPGSVLVVQGVYDGERVGRDGLVVVSGQCPLDAARMPGTAVETGTVLMGDGGRSWVVDDHGVLQSLDASRHHTVSGTAARSTLRWSQSRDRFVEA